MRTRTIIRQVARDARTGRFIRMKQARRHPSTTIVQTVRVRVKRRKR
jgi:hypothetical protein